MKILVLNGSPKGNDSITLQSVLFLQKKFSNDTFTVLNVGLQIKSFEKDFTRAIDAINDAELILFSYPVYTFIAPYQLHRFIELMKENISLLKLEGKYVTQLSTSKHFYDVTAQNYIEENCQDMKLTVLEGLSADMEDLTRKRGQQELLDFWRYNHFQIDYAKNKDQFSYNSDKSKYKVAIVTNAEKSDEKLLSRIAEFQNNFPYETKVFNVAEYPFAAGCLGCLKCAASGKCIHKDKFTDVLREQIVPCDATIYAFTIKDHSMGASFKIYDDRQFCNGHRTLSMDKPVGYIVNGDLSQEYNLQTVLKARASVGHNILVHIATEKSDQIKILSDKLTYLLNNPVVKPQNFYGIGGMKIFRDLIYVMGGMMKADYSFYKSKGFFNDLPTKQKKTRFFMKLVGFMMSNEKIMKKAGNKISEGMLMPYKKVLKDD